jgi:hypothetical protein
MPPRRADEEFPVEPTTERLICPTCAARLQRTAAMEPGVSIECPKCESVFVAPEYGGEAPATFTDRRGPGAAPRRAVPSDSPRRRPLRENYGPHWNADLGEWFSIAGRSWTRLMGPTVGYLFLVGFVVGGLAVVTAFLPLIVLGTMPRPGVAPEGLVTILIVQNLVLQPLIRLLGTTAFVGVFAVAIKELRGREWMFGDFFSGFQRFGAIFGYWLIQEAIGLVSSGPLLVVIIQMQTMGGPPEGMMGYLLGAYAYWGMLMLIYLYVAVRWFMVIALILDRDMGTLEAIRTSWNMTQNNVLILFAAGVLIFLMVLAGYLLCLIGILFAASYIALFYAAAYLEALYPRRATAYED